MSVRRGLSSPPPSHDLIFKVIAITAASTLLVAGVIFYFVYRYVMAQERRKITFGSSFPKGIPVDQKVSKQDRVLKRLDISDNGNNVLFLQKLESGQLDSFSTISFNPSKSEEKRSDSRRHGTKLLGHTQETPSVRKTSNITNFEQSLSFSSQPMPCNVILVKQSAPPPPPPPPLPVLPKKFPVPPIPQLPARRKPPAPPLPLQAPNRTSLKLPTDPRGKINSTRTEASTEKTSKGNVVVHMKMKPLHWDKIAANVDHSVVWNEINAGSLRFDEKLIEALFGYNASTPKPQETINISSTSARCSSMRTAQIFILDPRRSQNTAIILKSLACSCKDIQDAILEGQGLLDTDTLEKLTKISPTEDETEKILQFNGNHSNLAYAESFLYQLLNCIPSAFIRINAMLFRSNYDPEILLLKEALQTLEYGCKELRARGIFLKLLEAILRAGNHMNAGTVRGNAKGFNLTALQKISYIKSTDGKITLLQFVVEQIALAEGKRCVNNRKYDCESSSTQYMRSNDEDPDSHTNTELSEKEILKLGLSILGSLSTEFSNVKKAATINHDTLVNQCSNLTFCVGEIKQLINRCGIDEKGNYVKDMKGFIEGCEDELRIVREEQTRVMQLVKRTTEFYQSGSCNDKQGHPLQIFIFVRDFLEMVDRTCNDIEKKHQKSAKTVQSSLQTPSPSITAAAMYQNLQLYTTTDKLDSTTFSNSEDF